MFYVHFMSNVLITESSTDYAAKGFRRKGIDWKTTKEHYPLSH